MFQVASFYAVAFVINSYNYAHCYCKVVRRAYKCSFRHCQGNIYFITVHFTLSTAVLIVRSVHIEGVFWAMVQWCFTVFFTPVDSFFFVIHL